MSSYIYIYMFFCFVLFCFFVFFHGIYIYIYIYAVHVSTKQSPVGRNDEYMLYILYIMVSVQQTNFCLKMRNDAIFAQEVYRI